jgi:hypothetical protein
LPGPLAAAELEAELDPPLAGAEVVLVFELPHAASVSASASAAATVFQCDGFLMSSPGSLTSEWWFTPLR